MKPHTNHLCIKTGIAAAIALSAALQSATASTLLYSDNFNIPDTNSLDGSDQTGRHSGLLANDILVRSGGVQQEIAGNQLTFKTADPTGRVRFQPTSLPANTLYDFASGTSGTTILSAGGFQVDFDWTPDNNTAGAWLSFSLGYTSFDETIRINQTQTDFGILFRNNGQTVMFDNGNGTSGSNFDVSGGAYQRHATLTFAFGSFADGANVAANAYVDNVLVGTSNFTWDNNAGALYLELGNIESVKQLDSVSISTVPEPTSLALVTLAGAAALARRRSKV